MQPEKPVNVWFRREYGVGGQSRYSSQLAKSLGISGVTSYLIKDMTLFILSLDVYGPPKYFPTKKADV